MMTPDELSFLAAICENPGCDTPRLVFADWLQENGDDDRAEFVRVQVELAGMADPDDSPQRFRDYVCEKCGQRFCAEAVGLTCPACGVDYVRKWRVSDEDGSRKRGDELRRRERELFANGETHRWGFPDRIPCTPFPDAYAEGRGPGVPVGLIRRGFVESLTCTAEDWLERGDEIRRTSPVTHVTLTTVPEVEVGRGMSGGWRLRGRDRWCPGVITLLGRVGMRVGEQSIGTGDATVTRPPTVAEMLKAEWPGVAFTLPPPDPYDLPQVTLPWTNDELTNEIVQELAAPPPVPALPTDGWAAEVREDRFEHTRRIPLSRFEEVVRGLEFTIELPPPVVSITPGTEFGPVRGTLRDGTAVECERVYLNGYELVAPSGVVRYEARSLGAFRRL